jgi:hypothetical protein
MYDQVNLGTEFKQLPNKLPEILGWLFSAALYIATQVLLKTRTGKLRGKTQSDMDSAAMSQTLLHHIQ